MIAERSLAPRPRRRWVLLGVAVAAWAGFIALDRSNTRVVELGQPERLMIISDAGPIHVVERLDGAMATISESWFLGRPEIEREDLGGTTVLRVRCGGVSCRAETRVEVGPGIELVAINDGDVVQVDQFNGALTAISSGSSVELGAVVGSLRVTTDGSVRAARLDADVVDVAASEGDVDLRFISAPAEVTVRAGDGTIDIALPPGDGYDAELAAASIDVDDRVTVIDRDPDDPPVLPGRIVVRSAGDLTISALELASPTDE